MSVLAQDTHFVTPSFFPLSVKICKCLLLFYLFFNKNGIDMIQGPFVDRMQADR